MEQQIKNRISTICYASISSILTKQQQQKDEFMKIVLAKSQEYVQNAQISSDEFDVISFTQTKCSDMAEKLYSQYYQ
jgi:hypothetical protein